MSGLDKRIPVSESTRHQLRLYRDRHDYSSYDDALSELVPVDDASRE